MDKYWVWFSRINKIGAKVQNELIQKYKTPEEIFRLTKDKLQENNNLESEKIEIILDKSYRENLDKYLEYMEKNGIKMITIED